MIICEILYFELLFSFNRGRSFYPTNSSIIHSEHFACQQAVHISPLFQSAVSQGSCVLVPYIASDFAGAGSGFLCLSGMSHT